MELDREKLSEKSKKGWETRRENERFFDELAARSQKAILEGLQKTCAEEGHFCGMDCPCVELKRLRAKALIQEFVDEAKSKQEHRPISRTHSRRSVQLHGFRS